MNCLYPQFRGTLGRSQLVAEILASHAWCTRSVSMHPNKCGSYGLRTYIVLVQISELWMSVVDCMLDRLQDGRLDVIYNAYNYMHKIVGPVCIAPAPSASKHTSPISVGNSCVRHKCTIPMMSTSLEKCKQKIGQMNPKSKIMKSY